MANNLTIHNESSWNLKKKNMLYFGFLRVILPSKVFKNYPKNCWATPSRRLLFKATTNDRWPTTPTDTWRSSQQDATRNLGAHLDETLWSLVVAVKSFFPRPFFLGYGFWKLPYRFTNVFTISCGNALYLWCVWCFVGKYTHTLNVWDWESQWFVGVFCFEIIRKMFWMVKMIFRKHSSVHFLSLMKKIH